MMSKFNLFCRSSVLFIAAVGLILQSNVCFAQDDSAKADIVDTAIGAGDFKTLVAAVKAAGLVDALKGEGPFTVFAPSDAAFSKISSEKTKELLKPENKEALAKILTYHVVQGKVMASDVMKIKSADTLNGKALKISTKDGAVMINDAKVITADIACGNGIIHVIDAVIMPPADEKTLTSMKKDIIDTAMAGENFSTLVAAVKAAGLAETLKGEGPFTVFAPNNAAFSKLPAATLEELLKPENKEKLQGILTYHVVSGKVSAKDVVKLTNAKTVNGKDVSIAVTNGEVRVNDAKVIATDIGCENGIIHVIDTVILP